MNLKNEKVKNSIGLFLLLLGAALLILTFFTTYRVFVTPASLEGFAQLVTPSDGQGVGKILKVAVYPTAGLLLWVMGSVSTRLANLGYKIYTNKFGSEKD